MRSSRTAYQLAVLVCLLSSASLAASELGNHRTGCASLGASGEKAETVPLVRLISSPSKSTGILTWLLDRGGNRPSTIRTSGSLNYDLHGSSLCVGQESIDFGALENCVELRFDLRSADLDKQEMNRILYQWNWSFVVVEGRLEKRKQPSLHGNEHTIVVTRVRAEELGPHPAFCPGYDGPPADVTAIRERTKAARIRAYESLQLRDDPKPERK